MAAALALVAAVLLAAGTVLWQRGTLQVEARASEARFYAQILARPAWLIGTGLTIAGGLCQIAALGRGQIVVVQPIIMLSLVFALPFGVWLTDQRVGRREVVGALIVVAGLTAFLALSRPEGGLTTPPAERWLVSGAVVAVGVVVTALSARGRAPATVGALLGASAGIAFGFQAAVVKLFAGQLEQGLLTVFAQWSTYVLIFLLLAGGALQQASLKTGALAPAMATVNVANLLVSVVMGVWVFEETLRTHGVGLVWTLLALAVTAVGVVVLTSGGQPAPVSARTVVDGPGRRTP